jgi:threonine dehydratase
MEVVRYGLTQAGRFLVIRTRVRDRPGALAKLLARIAEERVNVLAVDHHREGMDIALAETEVELTLGTRDEAHCMELLERLGEWGYAVERLR